MVRSTQAFDGWRYRITRELRAGLVDCSTLTSQAHWSGAGLGIPFVAETQRIARSGQDVSVETMLPSDVLVRHGTQPPDQPRRRHNHVVLFLGEHPQRGPWVVESAEGIGVRARPLADADLEGGVRRFLPFPAEEFARATEALRVAAAVPKLGRLGARLTSGASGGRRHGGVDVYFSAPVDVLAPIGGALQLDPPGRDGATVARIVDASRGRVVRLGPLRITRSRRTEIAEGELLGRLTPGYQCGCNVIPALRALPRLHVELWSSAALPFWPEAGTIAVGGRSDAEQQAMSAYNVVYALKLGLVGPITTPGGAGRLARLPPAGRRPS